MKGWERDLMSMDRCELLRREAAGKRQQAQELRECAVFARVSADRAGIERLAAEFEADALVLEARAREVMHARLSPLPKGDAVGAYADIAGTGAPHASFQRVGLGRKAALIGSTAST